MTSKIIVNTIEADTGISSVTFASNINLQNDSSILVSSSGIRLGTGSTIAAPSANEIALSTNSAERFRIDSNGNIGIGVNNPSSFNSDGRNLVVGTGSGGQGISIYSANNSYGTIYFADGTSGSELYRGGLLYNHASDFLRFDTAGAERLRIASDGDLTLTGADNVEIKMKCGTSSGNNILAFLNSSGSTRGNITYDSDDNFLLFNVNQSERLRITSAGDVGIGTAVPITGSGYASLSLADTSGGQIELKKFGAQTHYIWSDNNLNIGADYSGTGQNLIFKVNGNNERVRITSAGRMGVGTNDPAALLEVRDSENTTKGVAQIRISKGVGNGAAPTSVSRADSYLHIGGSEYHTSFGRYNIAFGYTNDEVGSGIPAYIGFVETSLAGYTQGDLVFGTRSNTTGTDNPTERMRIDKDGHIRFGSSGTGYDSAWSHSSYGNTEVAIDGGGGYGVLHFRGDGAGSVNTRFSMGAGDEIFYMCYDDVNARHNIMVNSSGHVRMPAQPAFHAKGGTALADNTNTIIIGSGTEFNTGGHYSTSNGRFTAPVAGVYQFSFWGLLYPHASGVVNIFYSRNGSQYGHLVQGGADSSNHTSRSGTVIMNMSAGDYAELRINRGGNTGVNAYGSQWNMCGHLIG